MSEIWNFVTLPDMYYNILKFKTVKDKEEVMMNGPYTFRNMLLVLVE